MFLFFNHSTVFTTDSLSQQSLDARINKIDEYFWKELEDINESIEMNMRN